MYYETHLGVFLQVHIMPEAVDLLTWRLSQLTQRRVLLEI